MPKKFVLNQARLELLHLIGELEPTSNGTLALRLGIDVRAAWDRVNTLKKHGLVETEYKTELVALVEGRGYLKRSIAKPSTIHLTEKGRACLED